MKIPIAMETGARRPVRIMKKFVAAVGASLMLMSALAFAVPSVQQIEQAMARGNWQQADAGLAQVLEAHPNNARAHYLYGQVLDREGRAADALSQIQQAKTLDPQIRFTDPARFSLAHGGKDRHPYPVPIKVYDETIRVLKSAVQHARLGRDEEMGALQRLDDQARRLERTAQGPSLDSFIATERAASPGLDGRSVFGWERDLADPKAAG